MASLGAAALQDLKGAATSSATAGPGLVVIIAPIAAGACAALVAAMLYCQQRRRAARNAVLFDALPPGFVVIAQPAPLRSLAARRC
jgi:hypothetical protein